MPARFAFTDILPLASPRIIRQAPKWLLDPLGPLSVPPRYALKIAPWMLRFWRASWPAQVRASTVAQTALMALSKAALEPFMAAHGLVPMLRRTASCRSTRARPSSTRPCPAGRSREAAGIEFQHLTGDAIAERQPGLAPRFTHAHLHARLVFDRATPRTTPLALADRFRAMGGEIVSAEATRLLPERGADRGRT